MAAHQNYIYSASFQYSLAGDLLSSLSCHTTFSNKGSGLKPSINQNRRLMQFPVQGNLGVIFFLMHKIKTKTMSREKRLPNPNQIKLKSQSTLSLHTIFLPNLLFKYPQKVAIIHSSFKFFHLVSKGCHVNLSWNGLKKVFFIVRTTDWE